jgi:hypothetical protein
MESPLKRLANISGSTRAIAVAEAHRVHEEKKEEIITGSGITIVRRSKPRPLTQVFRQGSPAKPKKLSRDISVRVGNLNGPTASDRVKRAEEKRRRKAEHRL